MSYVSDGPVRRSNSTRIPPSYTNSLSREDSLYSIPQSKSVGVNLQNDLNNPKPTDETPLANRSRILDHTHATNQSVRIGQMSPTAVDQDNNAFTRTRSFFDDSSLNSNPASKLSVRRANGQRAESESVASLRKNQNKQLARFTSPTKSVQAENDHLEWGNQDVHQTGKPSKIPFASVRRIFRTRSKSQSAPSKASLITDKANTIKEVEEPPSQDLKTQDSKAKSPSNKSVALPNNHRRSKDMSGKHSSFFGFGRAKTPPRSRVDLEGVETEITRISSSGKRQTQAPQIIDRKLEKDVGETQDTTGSTIAGISGLPTSSDGVPPKVFGASDTQARMDRSLTLQSLSPHSPNLGRAGSVPSSPSVTPRKMTTDLQQVSGRGSQTNETPTPTNAPGSRGRVLTEEEKGIFDKNASPSSLVPRIWQVSRNSRSSLVDDSPTHDQFHSKIRYGSSATSGSASSFRTAPSFRDGVTPDPKYPNNESLSISTKGAFESLKSIPRAAPSPLSELIENLEQRISSSSTPISTPKNRELNLDKDSPMQSGSRFGASTSQPSGNQHVTVQFPSTHDTTFSTSIDDDQDESSFSHISQETPSALTPKRNTFGGDAYDRNKSPYLDANGEFGHIRRDVSMQDIETSLAAVEAALHDHIVEGSMDANILRQHILTPYNAGNISTGSFSVFNASNAGLDDTEAGALDDEARLARITLPPEQHTAIVNAVRQVRKAISSSQLPQIPNEEDSDVSRSPVFEIVPAIVSPNRNIAKVGSGDLLTSPANVQRSSSQSQRSSALRESTPMRAARVRQESMQDVEQAYERMIELVRSAAGIELIPSPMPISRSWSGRRSALSQPTPNSQNTNEPYEPRSSALSYVEAAQASPSQRVSQQRYVRERTQSAAPTPFSYQQIQRQNLADLTDRGGANALPVVPPLPPISATSSRSARQQLLRDSDALSRYMGPLPDLSEETSDSALQASAGLRGRSSNVSLGSFGSRRAASSSPPRLYSKLASQAEEPATNRFILSKDDIANKDTAQISRKYDNAVEQPLYAGIGSGSASGSGGGTGSGTSPSITVKTQGTPRLPDVENHASIINEGRPTHVRSTSQQVQDWQMRSRFSSPSSTRFPTEQQSKRTSAASNDSSSVAAGLRSMALTGKQIEEQMQYRKTRNQIASQGSGSGGAGGGRGSHAHTHSNSFTGGNQSPALVSVNGGNPESVSGSYRRSGSIRDWGRLEDLHHSSIRPASGASGSLAQFTKSYNSARGGFDNSEGSETARLALLNGRIASPSSSVSALQRRHALERDSLLDMLDRTRTEALDVRSRNEQLQSDLHQEVTRVLELQREVERQKEREEQLNARVQALEDELKAEHADRVRIGELLERVQRAVDDAANSRNAARRSHSDVDDDGISSAYDAAEETMEVVNGYDHDSQPREHDERMTAMDRNHSNEEDPKRISATSPTSSSSVSILQEDLFPIKRRVFDPIGIEDEIIGRRQENRRMQHGSGMEPIMSSSTIDKIEALQSERGQDGLHLDHQGYTANAEEEQENDPNNTLNPPAFDRSRSPSLRSYPSVLGLRTVDEHEMRWSLDKELPLQFSHDSASPPENERLNEISESDRQHSQPDDDTESHGDHSQVRIASSEDGSFAEDGSRPSVFRKRPSDQGSSKLPVLSKSLTGMSKSTSGASTILPSVSTSSSLVLDGKGRYPTQNPVNVRSRLAERFGGGKDMLNASVSSSSSSIAARSDKGIDEGREQASNQSSPSTHSIRFPSHGSRTTGGDTSYTAQTVSPIGSFIPTFPTMSSGVRRTSNNTNRSMSGSGIPTFNGNSSNRSPISSPSRKMHAGHTPVAKKTNSTSSSAGNYNSASAMRSAGGYYDTRRPAGYDPVDSSVLDVLGDDSANA